MTAALLLALAAPALARTPPAPATDLCPRVRFVGPAVKLTDLEKRLVCGDPGSDGWKEISLPQARQFMTAFLQARGRHFPAFGARDGTLEVSAGSATVVTRLVGDGLDEVYDLGKRRKIVGQLLTPDLLDKVQKGVAFELESRGYACPKVVVTADARDGVVRVDAAPGTPYALEGIAPADVPGIEPSAFDRYRAFVPGQPYDARLLALTADRIKADDLFLSAYYDVACTTGGARVVQRVVEGKPRLVTVGVGADTEGLVQGRMRLKQSRIGRRASSAEVSLFASRLQQSLDADASLYLSDTSRLYMYPAGYVRREDEIQYEAAHSEAAFSPAWTHDGSDFRVEVRGGPAYDYFNTIRGEGPTRSSWAAFVTRTVFRTHMYEYYRRDPRRGWTGTLETSSRVRGAYSHVTAHRVQVSGEGDWNLGNYEPPLLVLATRGLLGTTAASGGSSVAFAEVPPTERFFLGGDADLRGFQRKRLPDDAGGFLTAVYQGMELRAGDVLPGDVQPLVFVDAAMGGRRDFHLDADVYYSPGAGFRWVSPFGSVRATVARGLVWRNGSPTEAPRPHWQLFFSFGKEF